MRAVITPGAAEGAMQVPPSKSIAHRALLAAALCEQPCTLAGVAASEDIAATLRALRAFGAAAEAQPDGTLLVRGVPLPQAPDAPLDCGESGSTLRFLVPLLALTGKPVTLTGRGRLMARPQEVYAGLFAARGLPFAQSADSLRFCGPLPAGTYRLSGAVSSQFITGLLLALPLLRGNSLLRIDPPLESRPYVELTLAVQAAFGVRAFWQDELTLAVPGSQHYRRAAPFAVPGDDSQAAFVAALGALSGATRCLGLDPASRQGDRVIFEFLARLGAAPKRLADGSVLVRQAPLTAGEFDLADCPDLGPILMVLCCFAAGTSRILHAGRLRLKESDRIAAMQTELAKLGLVVECEGDTLVIRGNGGASCAAPREALCGHNDHRVVMALAVAASRCTGPVTITGAEAVAKSWPNFFADLQKTGVKVETLP